MTTTPKTMQAITQHRYGSPDVLEVEEVPVPEPGDDQLLIEVRAAAVNPYDWHMMTGAPWLVRLQNGFRRPKSPIQGADGSGVVVAVGADVTEFAPGDEVWGSFHGAFAQYSTASERGVVPKPDHVSFEQAAAIPIAGITALQGLRDKGELQAGQRVLVNGASGGVGTFAVMIAKAMGAHVTGVCSTRNVEMVRSIGADEVIDYSQTDYTKTGDRYDVILDTVTTKGIRANRRAMVEGGRWVQAGMKKKSSMVMLLLRMLKVKLSNIGSSKRMMNMLASIKKDDLEAMNGYLEAKEVVPVIDRTYPLVETADAMRHQGDGHAQGKTVVTN